MPLTQRINYSQAASITTPNVLSGQGVEYIGRASLLDLYGAAFLATANDQISLTSTLGGDAKTLIPSGSGINVNAAGPSMQSDGILNDAAIAAGAHLVLGLVSDATAGTHVGRFMIVLQP